MARKRASLQGRGSEILVGTDEGDVLASDAVPESPNSSDVEKAQDMPPVPARGEGEHQGPVDSPGELAPEWADILEEEALAATSEDAAPDPELLSLPPLATALARPAKPTKPAPGPVAIVSQPETPPAPMHSETSEVSQADAAFVPAPREKPEATDAAMRAKLNGLVYQQATTKPSDKDLEPEGPEAPETVIEEIVEYEAGQTSRVRRELEVLAYVGQAQRKALWDETLELYQAVPDILTGDANQALALRLLQEAQDILLERPRQFDMARFKVGQVQSLVSWRRNVNKWSNTYGWGICVYEVVWIAALIMGVFGAPVVADAISSLAGGEQAANGLLGLWSTMMWGGLGGVIGAFYSLYWHVAKVRDFDKQYSMWYIVQPVIGLLLGALTHLLIGSIFLAARQVTQAGEAVVLALFPYAVACIAGFRQRFILEMIDRVIQVITPSPEREPSPAEEAVAEETSESSS